MSEQELLMILKILSDDSAKMKGFLDGLLGILLKKGVIDQQDIQKLSGATGPTVNFVQVDDEFTQYRPTKKVHKDMNKRHICNNCTVKCKYREGLDCKSDREIFCLWRKKYE